VRRYPGSKLFIPYFINNFRHFPTKNHLKTPRLVLLSIQNIQTMIQSLFDSMSSITSDLEEMASLLTHVVTLSNRVGGFGDGPHLREQIQGDVKRLGSLSQQVKAAMTRLGGGPELDAYQSRFEELRERIRRDLEPVIQKLRSSTTPTGGDSAPAGPIFDQGLLDGETDLIDTLEQEVAAIVSVMREVSERFTQVMQELQAQRPRITAIEGETTAAVAQMESGNKALETASGHQKSTRKCICWIFIIVLLVVTAVVLIVLWQVFWKHTPTPTPGPPTQTAAPPTPARTPEPTPEPPTQSEEPPTQDLVMGDGT
jgi:hypothetical protein